MNVMLQISLNLHIKTDEYKTFEESELIPDVITLLNHKYFIIKINAESKKL